MSVKREAKNILSDMFFVFLNKHGSRIFKSNRFRILLYHAVEKTSLETDKMGLAVPPDLFYLHMKYLKDHNFFILDLRDALLRFRRHLPTPQKAIVITFDDGFKSILNNGQPILKEFGFPATVFVNVYFIEQRLPEHLYWHDWPTLNWEEVKWLHENGMAVGSHGISHKRLSKLSREELKKEIIDSKALIQLKISDAVEAFSYPHGAFNKTVKRALINGFYLCACTSLEGTNDRYSDFYALRRTEITAYDDTLLKFEKKLSGSHDWLGKVKKWNPGL